PDQWQPQNQFQSSASARRKPGAGVDVHACEYTQGGGRAEGSGNPEDEGVQPGFIRFTQFEVRFRGAPGGQERKEMEDAQEPQPKGNAHVQRPHEQTRLRPCQPGEMRGHMTMQSPKQPGAYGGIGNRQDGDGQGHGGETG